VPGAGARGSAAANSAVRVYGRRLAFIHDEDAVEPARTRARVRGGLARIVEPSAGASATAPGDTQQVHDSCHLGNVVPFEIFHTEPLQSLIGDWDRGGN
jgi:hypothetical protein